MIKKVETKMEISEPTICTGVFSEQSIKFIESLDWEGKKFKPEWYIGDATDEEKLRDARKKIKKLKEKIKELENKK